MLNLLDLAKVCSLFTIIRMRWNHVNWPGDTNLAANLGSGEGSGIHIVTKEWDIHGSDLDHFLHQTDVMGHDTEVGAAVRKQNHLRRKQMGMRSCSHGEEGSQHPHCALTLGMLEPAQNSPHQLRGHAEASSCQQCWSQLKCLLEQQ